MGGLGQGYALEAMAGAGCGGSATTAAHNAVKDIGMGGTGTAVGMHSDSISPVRDMSGSPSVPGMGAIMRTGTPRTPAGSLKGAAGSVLGLQLREEALRLIRFQNLDFLRDRQAHPQLVSQLDSMTADLADGGMGGSGSGSGSGSGGGGESHASQRPHVLTACAIEALCALELKRGKRTLFSYGSYASPRYGRWVRLAAAQSVLQMRMTAEPQARMTMEAQAKAEAAALANMESNGQAKNPMIAAVAAESGVGGYRGDMSDGSDSAL
jgi:hypothetical protein